MSGNIFKNPVQGSARSGLCRGMVRVVFASYHGVKTLVAPGLMHDTISIPGEQTCKFVSIGISR
jgi:hypothetical protein